LGTLYAPLVCKRVEVTESQFYPPSDFEWTLDPWDRRSRLARVSSVFRPYAPQVKASANLVTSIPLPLGSTIQVNAGWESGPEIVAGNSCKQTGITPRSGRLLRISSARSIEASSGITSQQNLYAIVAAVVDACGLRKVGNTDSLEDDQPILNVCRQIRSAPTPIVKDGAIGGIVLQNLVRGLDVVCLYEKVEKLPQWTTLPCFKKKIGIAVNLYET
jgi:hypothetical protein